MNKTSRAWCSLLAIYLLKLDGQVDSFISLKETVLDNNSFLEKEFTFFARTCKKFPKNGSFIWVNCYIYSYSLKFTWYKSYLFKPYNRVSNQLMRGTLNGPPYQLSKSFICQNLLLLSFQKIKLMFEKIFLTEILCFWMHKKPVI